MYPKVSLINKNKRNLVVFERDLNNPFNEGFIIYWEIIKSKNKQLIFKKRLTTIRAQKKLTKLKEKTTKINGKSRKHIIEMQNLISYLNNSERFESNEFLISDKIRMLRMKCISSLRDGDHFARSEVDSYGALTSPILKPISKVACLRQVLN